MIKILPLILLFILSSNSYAMKSMVCKSIGKSFLSPDNVPRVIVVMDMHTGSFEVEHIQNKSNSRRSTVLHDEYTRFYDNGLVFKKRADGTYIGKGNGSDLLYDYFEYDPKTKKLNIIPDEDFKKSFNIAVLASYDQCTSNSEVIECVQDISYDTSIKGKKPKTSCGKFKLFER